ncbi:MAG: RNA 2',3'-cyclic phosphodiesterase [Gemmatimonadetes bacterium]|nr:RNA 2',3'-cyclic phosphodiesterase [Gemmatimonadota bacterium]
MRLFIGLNLPKKERRRIQSATQVLQEKDFPVRWIGLENFHVTMKFLGEVSGEQVEPIEAAMSKVASQTRVFPIALGGFGAFPSIRSPSLIWLGIGASPELRCLKQDLEWALSQCGFESEARVFHPHITLARAKERAGAGMFRGLDKLLAELDFNGELKVDRINLIRSELSKNGARYSVVSSAKLASA